MTKARQKYLLITLCVVAVLIAKFAILDNVFVLFNFARELDEPSSLFYLTTERIYQLSANEEITDKIIGRLEESKDSHLHGLFIKVLGIVGEDDPRAINSIIKIYVEYQDNMNRQSLVLKAIATMGYISNTNTISILERLLFNYDKHRMVAPIYSIARSLYLSTGNNYEYVDVSGEKTKLHITEELLQAREVIVKSRGRYRTFEEMMILENLNRPDGYEKRRRSQVPTGQKIALLRLERDHVTGAVSMAAA